VTREGLVEHNGYVLFQAPATTATHNIVFSGKLHVGVDAPQTTDMSRASDLYVYTEPRLCSGARIASLF
jgi:hypothetical protein